MSRRKKLTFIQFLLIVWQYFDKIAGILQLRVLFSVAEPVFDSQITQFMGTICMLSFFCRKYYEFYYLLSPIWPYENPTVKKEKKRRKCRTDRATSFDKCSPIGRVEPRGQTLTLSRHFFEKSFFIKNFCWWKKKTKIYFTQRKQWETLRSRQ